MKKILPILVGAILLSLGFGGGYLTHQPQTKVVKVPVTQVVTKIVTQDMTCSGTLDENLSGTAQPIDGASLDSALGQGSNLVLNGKTPVTFTCTTVSH